MIVNPAQLHALKNATQFLLFAHLFWDKFYAVADTVGASMLPTFNLSNDWILISKLHIYGRGCQVGDIVSYVHPVYGAQRSVLKRIIGMPGDFVVRDPLDASGEMLQVPQGHVWTAGDNLPHSLDSRLYGPVPLGLVRGKVIAKLWPRLEWIRNPLTD